VAATFLFDSSYCTGCKACQVACKDKNHLPLGVMWRRVYEITGTGNWQENEGTWTSDVYAYNISMACNHCEYPKCAGVCPTKAYTIHPNGIVILDTQRCTGCGYCSWACPYGAPQYDEQAGTMTKCNFCEDDLAFGKAPACVAACPMRSLDYADLPGIYERPGFTQQVPPMPEPDSRNPRFFINPHPAVLQARQGDAHIANREEIRPRMVGRFEEAPLVAFTLLAQMAAGAFTEIGLVGLLSMNPGNLPIFRNSAMVLYSIGALILLSLLISFSHLGNPGNAWRVLSHLRKSWLSREILFTTMFGGLWAVTSISNIFQGGNLLLIILWGCTSLSGLAAIWSMARVYRLKTVPTWNTWQTAGAFFNSTALLGVLWAGVLLIISGPILHFNFSGTKGTGLIVAFLFILALAHAQLTGSMQNHRFQKQRVGFILAGFFGSIMVLIMPGALSTWLIFFVFILAALEEALGRIMFYESRTQDF